MPAPFPWRFTLEKKVLKLRMILSSVVSVFQRKKGNREIAPPHVSQMGAFNFPTPAHLTSKPHVSCKTLHLFSHTAAPHLRSPS